MTIKLSSNWNRLPIALEEMAERGIEEQVKRIADFAVDTTLTSKSNKGKMGAVDTGAYITSFSISYGRGRPRGKSSRRKPRNNPDLVGLGEVARADLYSDISKIDFLGTSTVYLRNNSPHAEFVEYKHGYYIFAKIEREFNG